MSRSAPRHPDVSASLLEDLAIANRILAFYEVLDGYGHVSVRHPNRPTHYLLSRSRAPELITPDDIMEFDQDSQVVGDDERTPYIERFIHGEIYRARPDVHAIVHSHSPSVVPFTASSVQLRPICHMAGFLSGGAPVFDIRQRFGTTDLLVRNGDHGEELAHILGQNQVALMRGHGFVAVGATVQLAVYRAMYTETNSALQQKAIALGGEITFLDEAEAATADAAISTTVERPWELWKRKVSLSN